MAGQRCLLALLAVGGCIRSGFEEHKKPDTCIDAQRDGDETDRDCGGSSCDRRCAVFQACETSDDCGSGLCFNQHCAVAGACPTTADDGRAPALFFTDLTSGPTSGGEDDLGVFITIYGERLGAARDASTVTLGGVEVARYVSWGENNGPRCLDKVVIQPGAACPTGDLVLTVNGQATNGLPFTARSGNIYFVSPESDAASDGNPGDVDLPFATIHAPRDVMTNGDVVYIKGGVFDEADPLADNANLALSPVDGAQSGLPSRPIAYVGYPDAPPVIGGAGLTCIATGGDLVAGDSVDNYVFANLILDACYSPLAEFGVGWRLVGLQVQNPVADIGPSRPDAAVLGNLLIGGMAGVSTARYMAQPTRLDVGWNDLRSASLVVYALAESLQEDIRVHDNLVVEGEVQIGSAFAAPPVTLGLIELYNNVLVTSSGPGIKLLNPHGDLRIQDNTIYWPTYAPFWIEGTAGDVRIENNILVAATNASYCDGDCSGVVATNNLCFGSNADAVGSAAVLGDPLFVDPPGLDLRLTAGSAALDAGIDTGRARDFSGVPRPLGGPYDLGAIEGAD